MSPSFTRAYPFVMERGQRCWPTDVDDNGFLDSTAGIAVVTTGHSHPRVVAAIKEQAERFLHMSGTDFNYSSEIELAERLENRLVPGTPARVFFTNSGAEAIEGAMKLARYATGRPSYIAFIGAFHGRTFGALSLTASKASQRRRFAPLLSSVFHAPFPTASRGVTTDQSIERIEELFATVAPPESVAAVFVEPIQGEGGYLVPPDDFLPGLRELTSSHQDVTDVRVLGLMLALEFKTPEQAAKLVQSAFERGLLLLTAGIRAVRISPPLVLNPDDAATGLEIIASALD